MVGPIPVPSRLSKPAPLNRQILEGAAGPRASMDDGGSTPSSIPARQKTHSLSNTTTKRYTAPLSSGSKPRPTSISTSFNLSAGAGPSSAASHGRSRSASGATSFSPGRSPISPGGKSPGRSPYLGPFSASEMDVSMVDPEEVLVDHTTVEPADLSLEMEEDGLKDILGSLGQNRQADTGKEDKVMVSVRVRPTDGQIAWIPSTSSGNIKLDPAYIKPAAQTSAANTTDFTFDAVLMGTPNKPIYTTVARAHVFAAMDGYNAVVFAYGQTASGKTFTLSGDEEEPGIIPRALKDVFGYIKKTEDREYLLRCSYLEIYNENIHDLLAPPSLAAANPVQIQGNGGGNDIVLAPLREEVITSLKGVRDVLKRGEGNRRTACTDWNERSSRSHSVFRLVIESRERDTEKDDEGVQMYSGRLTPGGRRTPGMGGRTTPGGSRLQAKGGRSVRTSVLSLIDLAGSEKATSDRDRTREGKYINTSLLTLGTVIGTLADNAAKRKTDHVPYRNSKLTRMLQPSLSGNARISVICTINPDMNYIQESTSTLLFAKRIKSVQLHAQKKEVVDTDALIERYRKEIEELKKRLAEREADAPVKDRRLSTQEQLDESKDMSDLNNRIQQLTKLILTSQTVEDAISRPASPSKIDFDMSPYQLQQELLAARLQVETQASQILSLEAALTNANKPSSAIPFPYSEAEFSDPEQERDQLSASQRQRIGELENVARRHEMKGDGKRGRWEEEEKTLITQLEEERKMRVEKEKWANELVKQLEKEKKARTKLEEERKVLAAFVSKFDSLNSGATAHPTARSPTTGSALAAYAERQQQRQSLLNGPSTKGIFASRHSLTLLSNAALPMIPATPGRASTGSQAPSYISQESGGSEDTGTSSANEDFYSFPSESASSLEVGEGDEVEAGGYEYQLGLDEPTTPNPGRTRRLSSASFAGTVEPLSLQFSGDSFSTPDARPIGKAGDGQVYGGMDPSPIKLSLATLAAQQNLFEQQMLEEEWSMMSDPDLSDGDVPLIEVVPPPPLSSLPVLPSSQSNNGDGGDLGYGDGRSSGKLSFGTSGGFRKNGPFGVVLKSVLGNNGKGKENLPAA